MVFLFILRNIVTHINILKSLFLTCTFCFLILTKKENKKRKKNIELELKISFLEEES